MRHSWIANGLAGMILPMAKASVRLVRGIVAAVILASLAAPYTRPVACGFSGTMPAATELPARTDQTVWSSAGDAGACHDFAGCAVAHVGPTLDGPETVPTMPVHVEAVVLHLRAVAPNPPSPLTPPPRA